MRTPADPAAVSDRVRYLLELAHAEANGIVAAARDRAAAIVREAEETADRRDADARERACRIVDDARRRTADRLRLVDAFLADAETLLEADAPLRAAA